MKLHNSIVLKQTFALIIMAILFSSLMMIIWVNYTTTKVNNSRLVETLQQQADALSQSVRSFEEAEIEAATLAYALENSPALLNAGILVQLNRETSWAKSYFPQSNFWQNANVASFERLISLYRADIYSGNKVVFSSEFENNGQKNTLLFVGSPIQHTTSNNITENIGSIYIIKNLNEESQNLLSLFFAFLSSLLVTLGFMLLPAILVIIRIVSPLLEIQEMAQSLATGNFEQHIDEKKYHSEFKTLSLSINTMSYSLQNTFQQLASESERLSQILSTLNEGILACSSSLTLTHINPMFKTLFKEEDQLHIGGSIKDLKNQQLLQEILYVHRYGREKNMLISKGDKIFQVFLLPVLTQDDLNNDETCYPLVCLFKDITQEERLEQTRKDYVANVSHELKTPITALRCLIEPIMDGIVHKEEELQRYYSTLYNETLRLSRLVDDMLELSRLQSGKLQLKKDVFDLSSLLYSIKIKFSPVMQEKGIQFSFNIALEDLPPVLSDQDRIEQILYILLDNASKFTSKGGEISLHGEEKGNKYYLSVSDTGIGINETDQEHIFERFYKADKSRGKSGTGLGLSIAKEIMDQLGETITVQSVLGKGTTFTLSLSLAEEDTLIWHSNADPKHALPPVKRIL